MVLLCGTLVTKKKYVRKPTGQLEPTSQNQDHLFFKKKQILPKNIPLRRGYVKIHPCESKHQPAELKVQSFDKKNLNNAHKM